MYDENGEEFVCKLKKSLYGLKQSGRNWNNMLDSYLKSEGFDQSHADPCMYRRVTNDGTVIVLIWVDDLIIATSNDGLMVQVKESLANRFKMKDLGPLSWFLGIEFKCQEGSIEMNQTKYLESVLKRFNMSECKPKTIPCDIGSNKPEDSSEELADCTLYREIVGSLIYCMTATRPDLCYVVTYLSQFMSKPTKVHMGIAKRVLRYIKGTIDQSVIFTKSDEPVKLYGYCDADWASEVDRKSITGYAFRLTPRGPLISYKSRKQQSVALSTCEAEYMAI